MLDIGCTPGIGGLANGHPHRDNAKDHLIRNRLRGAGGTMPDKGEDLGVDLYQLWRAGRDNLPSVAVEYAAANDHVANTDKGLSTTFLRPTQFGGGSYGPVYASWKALRDEFQTILGDTSKNLELVGESLCLAANEYAKADGAAADELRRLKKTDGDFPPIKVPQPRYP
jgi:hypothetical protein